MAVTRNNDAASPDMLVYSPGESGTVSQASQTELSGGLVRGNIPGTVGINDQAASQANYVLAPGYPSPDSSTFKVIENGPYKVEMAGDGAIKVRPGDWLSKYSAAIHNDFTRVLEYGRLSKSGAVERIVDYDLIYAGETIYHLPTLGHSLPSSRILSEDEKKRIALRVLEAEYDIAGENAEKLAKAIDYIGYVDNALLAGQLAGVVSEASAVAGAVSGLNAVLLPVSLGIVLVNTIQTGQRIYALRAICYASTAWAFGESPPTESAKIIKRIRNSGLGDQVKFYNKAWKEATESAIKGLDGFVAEKGIEKSVYQTLLRSVGKGNRADVCLFFLKGFEEEVPIEGALRTSWKNKYNILYPN